MSNHFEIAVLGAGPGGLGAAGNAAAHKLSHVLVEKSEIGNTIFEYQLRKHVMAEPGKLPLRAKVGFDAGTREKVLDTWANGLKELGVNLRKGSVSTIKKAGDKFEIQCGSEVITANKVVLAIGVQGTPRKLDVPGDNLPHVSYTLRDPDAFKNQDILVVGAGDAAIENALALMDNNRVSILNRTTDFARAKDANNTLIMKAIESGKITCFYNAAVTRVEAETTYIETPDGELALKCSQIIARIGAIMPRKFLESCGIKFPSQEMSAVPSVSKSYESNVPGLYIIGALIGYPLIKQAMNQGHEVIEHILGNPIEPADQVLIVEKLKHLGGDANVQLAMLREKLPLFKDLSEPQFRELIAESTVHQIKSGETVFKRNDYTDTFFSIVSGSVNVELDDGRKVELPEGGYFGEVGLLSGRRRNATISVAKTGLLLESPRKQILKLISSVDSIRAAIDKKFVVNALQASIFPDVDRAFIEELASRAKAKKFKKGEVLFREGDAGDFLYVIRKGSVKVSKGNAHGEQVTRTYVPAGNFVGEMALLSKEGGVRSATCSAAVSCDTIVLSKDDLNAVMEKYPAARKRLETISEKRQVENITVETDQRTGELLDFMLAQGISDADNVLLIDSDLCVGCDNCESACASTHNGYSRLDRKGGKSFASIQVPISCRHCENPLCMTDCPPDALTRLPNGEVVIRDSCIGCGNCVSNCPYGVIQLVYDKGSLSLLEMLGLKKKEKGPAKAGKCDMCSNLGSGPACVRACPTGAAMRVNPKRMLEIVREKQGDVV